MKVKKIKDNLMQQFQATFNQIFNEPQFGFKADGKLIAMLVASLAHEHIAKTDDSIL